MPRGKQGTKTVRAEKNRQFQSDLRERKRLRAERREQQPVQVHEVSDAELAAASPAFATFLELKPLTMPQLRALCAERGIATASRDRKADLISKLVTP